MTHPSRSERSSAGGGSWFVAVVVGGIVALVVAGALLVGVRGPADGDDDAVTTPTPASHATTTSTSTPRDGALDQGAVGPAVTLAAHNGDGFAPAPTVVDELPPSAVIRVTANGFDPYAKGVVEQCAGTSCTNAFPVTFDEFGVAQFQYLLHRAVGMTETGPSTCRADEPPCIVRVRTDTSVAYLATFTSDPAPRPREVFTEPDLRDVEDGERISISVRNFLPGESLRAVICAAPHTVGVERCGAPGPVASFVVDSKGEGSATIVVKRGAVGTESLHCGRERDCGVVVQSVGSVVPASAARIDFSLGPSASYDATRVVVGFLLALSLLGVAVYLIRMTDWRKPTEADTPELDAAVLSDV
jgi:hypothetical protein